MNYDLYLKAIHFATQHHGDQVYGQLPYVHHLLAVERQLLISNFHPNTDDRFRKVSSEIAMDLLVACIQHDVLEDTPVTRSELRDKFGMTIEGLVWAVTNGEGDNRAERFASVYPKIRETPFAVIVKLCDRLANMESCLGFRLTKDRRKVHGKLKMYIQEYPKFRKELYQEGPEKNMWDRLDAIVVQNGGVIY